MMTEATFFDLLIREPIDGLRRALEKRLERRRARSVMSQTDAIVVRVEPKLPHYLPPIAIEAVHGFVERRAFRQIRERVKLLQISGPE